MKVVEEKIIECGKALKGDILKVDNFLNHQIDVKFMQTIGKCFYDYFKDRNINKILTIEASGIAIGFATAQYFNNCDLIFAKKGNANNMAAEKYQANLFSYTRQKELIAAVSKEYLCKDDKVLILDDFLANGSSLKALISICKQANVEIKGIGVVIEKKYQGGGDTIRKMGYDIYSLASISRMNENKIEFFKENN